MCLRYLLGSQVNYELLREFIYNPLADMHALMRDS